MYLAPSGHISVPAKVQFQGLEQRFVKVCKGAKRRHRALAVLLVVLPLALVLGSVGVVVGAMAVCLLQSPCGWKLALNATSSLQSSCSLTSIICEPCHLSTDLRRRRHQHARIFRSRWPAEAAVQFAEPLDANSPTASLVIYPIAFVSRTIGPNLRAFAVPPRCSNEGQSHQTGARPRKFLVQETVSRIRVC